MKIERVAVLGGNGNIGRIISRELAADERILELTIADLVQAAPEKLAQDLGGGRVRGQSIDLYDGKALEALFKKHDWVYNATPYRFGQTVYEAAIRAGGKYLDLGGVLTLPEQWDDVHARAKKSGAVLIFNCGATPGLTNLLAAHGAKKLKSVSKIEVAFATFRPLGLSPGLLATVLDEFTPENPERRVYENGEFKEMPPFARRRRVEFMDPVGAQYVYVVPHEETLSLPRHVPSATSVTAHGTWRPSQMALIKKLNDLHLLSRDPIEIDGHSTTPRRMAEVMLTRFPPKDKEKGFFFYLVVEVHGKGAKGEVTRRYRTKHPVWDQTTTARMTGIPAAHIFLGLAGKEKVDAGAWCPEQVLQLEDVTDGLKARGIELEVTEK